MKSQKVEMSSYYGKFGNTDLLGMSLEDLYNDQKIMQDLERDIYELSVKEYEEHHGMDCEGYSDMKSYSLQPKKNRFRQKFKALFFTATVFYLGMVLVMSMFILWKFQQ